MWQVEALSCGAVWPLGGSHRMLVGMSFLGCYEQLVGMINESKVLYRMTNIDSTLIDDSYR